MKSPLWLAVPLCFAAQGCAATANITTDQLPLKRVVVYRNGVGYFERSGHVATDQVTFKMRGRMVGDFLATLAIVERGGSSVRSASFPLEIFDDAEPEPPVPPPGLLKPMPLPEPKKHDPNALREVVLRLDGSEHDLSIGYVAETPVWRPSYRVVVRADGQADLQVWGIVQNLSGEDWEAVQLGLVAGAPLAFQSTLGDPVIPGRPIITDTGEVISSMPTGVVSLEEAPPGDVDRFGGAPAPAAPPPPPEAEDSKDEDDGYGRAERKPMPKRRSAANMPMPAATASPYSGAGPGGAAVMGGGEAGGWAPPRADGPSPPRRVSALAAVAVESGTTRYDIPVPVSVPDESATMVLLSNQRVPGEMVFLFAPDGGVPDSASHPFRVARFANATKGLLERGPIAVFEKGSFLGQGLLEPLPAGAKATVPFALERALAVESTQTFDQQSARLAKLEAGELWIERDTVQKTVYKIKNGSDTAARLLVRHARAQGTRLHHPVPGTEDNTGTGYALVPVTVRPKAAAELTVDERRGQPMRVEWTSDLAEEAVKAFMADSRADKALVAKLGEVWTLRNALRASMDEHQKLRTEQAELEKATRETRLSLEAIEKNTQAADLRAKLTRRLTEFTGRLEQITKRLVELGLTLSEQQVRFREGVRELRFTGPLPPP